MNQILLYELASKKITPVTDTWYESYHPQFSQDGKYLVFISDRDFNPIYSHRMEYRLYRYVPRLYFTARRKYKNPILPKNDEVNLEKEKAEESKTKEEKPVSIVISLDGIQNRIASYQFLPQIIME